MNKNAIAEMNDGIILARYEEKSPNIGSYQLEWELEYRLMEILQNQGYERIKINHVEDLYENLKDKIEKLNSVSFSPREWKRFLNEYLDAPSDGVVERTRKIQDDHIYTFTFESGELKNIKIIDKNNLGNNYLQVLNQMHQENNRYDVTILVNGIPMVQIELKKRGENLKNAFNQIQRYIDESFDSLYKYVQMFVISNGTYTRYFPNTTLRSKNNYEFTIEWADVRNKVICDLEDFAKTFFEKRSILSIITKYCVFDTNNDLLILRPYQIAATERIIWKIISSYNNKKYGTIDAGGFIWHTTGSGKTLTSFKAAKLATSLDFIDKVFFVVDRKDLDYQTQKEYKKFSPDSVTGSISTRKLKENIERNDNKIVVTTIQKLNEFVKKNPNHPIYNKQCVLIYDECHRSQFGDAQKNITKSFKKYYQFGFTGTPIFEENSIDRTTTASIFGAQLHSYVITDAIRDGKVLKFKVDYNNVAPKYKEVEKKIVEDEERLKKIENKLIYHKDRINEIAKYILKVFNTKTHRNEYYNIKEKRIRGFNSLFAVQDINLAKLYYETFKELQKDVKEEDRLKIFTIFSYAPNEERNSIGDINDESFEPSALDYTSKQFLSKVIDDYNKTFKTNHTLEGQSFENFYQEISKKVQEKEIDMLIVVGMFLTGFDSKTLNTLFVDKNLRYHGLIQAFSRTNRILNSVKTFGNIVCFRDLQKATIDAIKTFGDKNSIHIILERSFKEYMNGFTESETGKYIRGYKEVLFDLLENFPVPTNIHIEKDKKEFAKIFGELLKLENILKNFDEFQKSDIRINERLLQDYKSTYIDIMNQQSRPDNKPKNDEDTNAVDVDFGDVEFHVDLLRTDEINLDYIVNLLYEKRMEERKVLEDDIERIMSSSIATRPQIDLMKKFIRSYKLDEFNGADDFTSAFYNYAKKEKESDIEELVKTERLKEGASEYIRKTIDRGYVENTGTELDSIVVGSRIGGERQKKKKNLIIKLKGLVGKFLGV